MYKNILIITDNLNLTISFEKLIAGTESERNFDFAISPFSDKNLFENDLVQEVKVYDLKKTSTISSIIEQYDLVFSMHCKQIFPSKLVQNVKCINIHPGYNPFNRGWYPQVFSIIHDLPIGATIHEIDEKLDNGPIIDRIQVDKNAWDTSLDLYERVVEAEIKLLKKNLPKILEGKYLTIKPEFSGKTYLKKDFKKLLEIDTSEKITSIGFINRLRALTHGDYKNSYFIDPETGKKIFVKIQLTPEI
ncbi:dTDP-4-amino-4,6-dideoxyglucose formyltransferase [uncultured Salegentibacter sp.]|uniref:dTDP-4-amino-4,6-dideoxyglucose formyltransferase n=1 Tax=uncultured Salegentibacter sp. TaxID=259320 RepID=UPI002598C575|nr:dTDP-4-amino-4,6-dideoxyglucose formyltransferase [uncultured Salegentibacter sp.]